MICTVSDILVVGPEGELGSFEGRLLLKKIEESIDAEWNKIVIDFTQVDHIHFRVLNDLLVMALASALVSGGIKLAAIRPYHRQLLRLSGVEGYFETYDSVADAVLSFQDPLMHSLQ